MSTAGKRLLKAAGECISIAKGEADPATYRVHYPTKPSVDEIVARWESAMNEGWTLPPMEQPHLRALIADWRKRGEALERIAEEDRGMWAGHVARAALPPKP